MTSLRIYWIGLVLIAFADCAFVYAQGDAEAAPRREIAAPTSLSPTGPFSNDASRLQFSKLQVLSADEMTAHDRDVLADAESSIQERAGFENLEFNEGHWNYAQIVCPALPNHLLLRFTRDEGTRAMSMFSAAIPRNGEGRVRIIPIVRKGYSLFSPAPIGPLTIAAFNRIRGEENQGSAPDWLITGMCYAALAGANPQPVILQSDEEMEASVPLTIAPVLRVGSDGATVVTFDDASAKPRPEEWRLYFDPKGRLLKATHASIDAARKNSVRSIETKEYAWPEKRP